MSLWTLAPSFVCAQTQPQPATGPATTDLRALQGAARRSSHDLAAAHHASLAATAQLDEAKISPFFQFTAQAGFAWVPDADGTVGYTPNARNQLERDFGPGLQGRIDGAIPLWTFGKLEAARAAARAGIEAAEHDRTRVLQQLRFNIRRAYFGLQLALDTQQMIREGLPKLEQALQRLQDRLAEGDPEVEEASRYRLATALAEVRARKSETDRLEYSTRTALRTLTGLKQVHVPDCPLEPVEYRVQPLERYRRQANRRPELGMVQAAQSARQANLDATVAKYFPDLALALEARADYVPGRTRFEHYTPYYLGAAVVARWSLDLWGQSKRAERARQQLLETRSKARLLAQGIELEVADKHAALLDAQRRVAAWEVGRREARRWFVSAAQGHQVGVTTSRELVDGVSAYFKARFSHLQAIHDFNVGLAALELASGSELLTTQQWNQPCDG